MFDEETVSGNSEHEYIRKAACGDHNAFGKLVLVYETPILTYLQSILGNWENARDLTQETFIAAFYDLPRWQPPEQLHHGQSAAQNSAHTARFSLNHPLAPWLYRIATNQALTFLKQQSRYKRTGIALSPEDHTDTIQISESAKKPQSFVAAWEDRYVVRELLHEALSQLATEDALCIILRFVAGERYTEIADRSGMTKEAVRKRVTRGLVVLRSVYKALEQEK
ncbi:RNA polymerase sigma factor [Ktedonobacteria bacterium brp13]|nr:RNA polymerase sigma factor [Ktedonobacteria bacterium brp13]